MLGRCYFSLDVILILCSLDIAGGWHTPVQAAVVFAGAECQLLLLKVEQLRASVATQGAAAACSAVYLYFLFYFIRCMILKLI